MSCLSLLYRNDHNLDSENNCNTNSIPYHILDGQQNGFQLRESYSIVSNIAESAISNEYNLELVMRIDHWSHIMSQDSIDVSAIIQICFCNLLWPCVNNSFQAKLLSFYRLEGIIIIKRMNYVVDYGCKRWNELSYNNYPEWYHVELLMKILMSYYIYLCL